MVQPWASPVVMVQKKDGTRHFCINYCMLNSVTTADLFPHEVKYLGHTVIPERLGTDNKLVEAVHNFPQPQSVSEVCMHRKPELAS